MLDDIETLTEEVEITYISSAQQQIEGCEGRASPNNETHSSLSLQTVPEKKTLSPNETLVQSNHESAYNSDRPYEYYKRIIDETGRISGSTRTIEEASSTHKHLVLSVVTHSRNVQKKPDLTYCEASSSVSNMLCEVLSFRNDIPSLTLSELGQSESILSLTSGRSPASDTETNPYLYIPYYEKTDFLADNWAKAKNYEKNTVYGMAVVATATVIVHPLVFIAGAATAVWAVGVFHAVEQGYTFFSDKSFSQMFWDDAEEPTNFCFPPSENEVEIISMQSKRLQDAKLKAKEYSDQLVESRSSENDCIEDVPGLQVKPAISDCDNKTPSVTGLPQHVVPSTESISAKQTLLSSQSSQTPTLLNPPSHETQTTKQESHKAKSQDTDQQPTIDTTPSPAVTFVTTKDSYITLRDIIKTNFPPLKVKVATGVPFMGLNAEEFFDVFFSDKAPYSFEAFQKTRGDVDIKYSNWETAIDDSFPNMLAHKSYNVPLPRINEKERKCTFRTLTKSYFGPAYASASKVMKFTTVGKNLLVLDARTKLSGIPYGDRFYVEERWVIESVKDRSMCDESLVNKDKRRTVYKSELSVYVEVKMIKSCTWEEQIKKKTLSTMTEMLDTWCQRATAALQLAEMERKKRELATDLKSGEPQDVSGRKVENVNLCNDASEPVKKETEIQKVMVDVKKTVSIERHTKDTDTGTTVSIESLDEESHCTVNVRKNEDLIVLKNIPTSSSKPSLENVIKSNASADVKLMEMHKTKLKEIEECLVSSGAQSDDAKKCILNVLEESQQEKRSLRRKGSSMLKGLKRKFSKKSFSPKN